MHRMFFIECYSCRGDTSFVQRTCVILLRVESEEGGNMHSPPLPDEQTIPHNQEDFATQQISAKDFEAVEKRKQRRVSAFVPRLLLGMIVGIIVALCVFLLYGSPISTGRNGSVVKGKVRSVRMPTEAGSAGTTPAVSPTVTRGPMQVAVGTTATPVVRATPTMIATQVVTPTPSPTLVPTPSPTAPLVPTDTPTPLTGVNGNPWGYDFVPGQRIYTTPADFCRYFTCISDFENGNGYVVECSDGQYSRLGGKHGTCSHHGRVVQPLYSH